MNDRKRDNDGGLRRCDAVLLHDGEQVGGRFQSLTHRDAALEVEEREEAARFPDFLREGSGDPACLEGMEMPVLDPAEDAVREIAPSEEREREREEVFRGLMGYVFGGGIHPSAMLPRLFSLVRAVRPLWLARIDGQVLRLLWGGEDARARDGIASIWWRRTERVPGLAGRLEGILRETVDAGLMRLAELPPVELADLLRSRRRRETVAELVEFLTRGGRVLDVVHLGRRMYGLGKALAEEEIDTASLQVLGDLSDETRAVWSLRIIDLREELQASGIRIVRFQFQKSVAAVEAYREAQLRVWGSGQRPRKKKEKRKVKLGLRR